jgi:hypothetical protein
MVKIHKTETVLFAYFRENLVQIHLVGEQYKNAGSNVRGGCGKTKCFFQIS